MVGVDGDDDFHIVHQTFQHAELGVRLKAGQHARGVVVVEELASEFQIEFAAELRDAACSSMYFSLSNPWRIEVGIPFRTTS